MASLLKKCRHPRSSWDECGCAWYLRDRSGGKDTYRPVGGDREVAERALSRHDKGRDETVAMALEAWLAMKRRDPKTKPNSMRSYKARADHVRGVLGPNTVRSLRDSDLTKFAGDMLEAGYAPATIQGIYACLTATLRHAQRRGVISAVPLPVDGPGIPSPEPRDHRLTLAQVDTIIAGMAGDAGKLAELVYLTGLRWGEAAAVERGDIDGTVLRVRRTRNMDGGTNAPKTRAGYRVIPLSQRALALLAELDLPVGGDYREARKALVAAMGDLHRPGMGWHTLRNAHASLLEAAGVTLRDQAARMGHGTNYAQTLAYGLAHQAGSADALDTARLHASHPASASSESDELAARRAARQRRAQGG